MAEIIQKKKYSDLPKTTTLKDDDLVMVSDGTTSKVITTNNLKAEVTKDIQVDTTNLATKDELTNGLNSKANLGHTHSEYATTTQLNTKADSNHNHDNTYASKSSEHTHTNKAELDKIQIGDKDKWDSKAEISAIPTKTSQLTNDSNFVNQTQLGAKADKIDTYTKTEVDALIDGVSAGDVDLTNYYNKTETDNKLNLKVDKITGKGLSQNDLTNALKINYDVAYTHSQQTHAPVNAEQNVQSDWNMVDINSDAYIKNKPTNLATTEQITPMQNSINNLNTKSEKALYFGESIVGSVDIENNILGKMDKIENTDIPKIKTDLESNNIQLQEHLNNHPVGGCDFDILGDIDDIGTDQTVNVTGVSLDTNTINFNIGNTRQLVANVLPSNATNKSVTWTTSNSSVATVSTTGLVTATGVGNSTITVTTSDGGKTAVCNVTVQTQTINVTGVSLNKTTLTLTNGNSEQLTATVSPSNATNKNVTWSSSNTSVATVSSNGLVTGIGVGSSTITVRTADGNKTATCSLTVTGIVSNYLTVSPTSYNISGNTLTINYTSNKTLTDVKLSTNNGTSYDISNTSFTQTSATFNLTNSDGTYTCKLRGSYEDGSGGSISVTGVSLNKSSTSIVNGSTEQLTATIIPSNATNKSVTWTSSNTSIATVSATGLVTGVGAGSTIITVRTVDGNISSTCSVSVTSSGSGSGTEWVPDLNQFGISNSGTNAQATSDGLNAMIEYASANGKSIIKMPTGTYLIQKDTPVNLKSNITLDLNGATFKMENNNKPGYQILILKEVSNVTIKNGTLEGDRYTHDYTGYDANTNSHEFGISIRLDQAAENCIIENMTIKKMSGYGIYTAQGQGYGTTLKLDRNKLESGSYSNTGSKISDNTKIRYSEGINISGFANLGYFQVGTYLKYQNFLFNKTRTVTALIFNASNVLVKSVTTQLYRPIEINSDARTAYLIFHQADPTDLLGDNSMYSLDIFHMKPNKNCIIRNNVFDDNRCLGLAVCGGWNLLVENNEFKNTSKDPATVSSEIWQAGKPGYGIDIEDGWEGTEDLVIKKNTFSNNWFGDIVAMAGDGMIIEDNDFTRSMYCYSRMTNYTIKNNRWNGGSANYDTEKDHGATITGNVYNDTAISGEYYKITGFTRNMVYENETVNGGKFINHKSVVLKDSTIDLKGVVATPFQGTFNNCTIKNVDGTTNGAKHNGIVQTGVYCDRCTITNSAFFPSKESVFNNGSLSSKRIRLDGGTLEVQNNDINGTVIVLNGGTKATIKDNRLSGISGDFITNTAGITLDASNNNNV